MELFEGIIKTLLEHEGYWVRQSFKVNVTKEEKRAIGKHSIPRPEIDLLAFKPCLNEVLVIEAKSYFDSPGVKIAELMERHDVPDGRYKLFTCENYRNVVFARLHQDLLEQGLVKDDCNYKLGLVAGNVYQNKSIDIAEYFQVNEWFFWSPEMIKEKVNNLAHIGYENNTVTLTAKILMRGNSMVGSSLPNKNTRQLAKQWLIETYPSQEKISFSCSKYYEDNEIWFFTIPLTVIDSDKPLNLLLQKTTSNGFYFLQVPTGFLKDNLDKLSVRTDQSKFDLHLSAKSISRFVDVRGASLEFTPFLKTAI